ncbi:hypothetical protein F2P81_008866 [Scophthalmus maximus]|uniref:Uncharacterized protein n=1 Tax=Scophthalmus maximus TaxID=52904 RepID=A0A6A4T8A7_SCOMX|nr:hypothetical protein F2P81_008866 [Scophthalmus maximus]
MERGVLSQRDSCAAIAEAYDHSDTMQIRLSACSLEYKRKRDRRTENTLFWVKSTDDVWCSSTVLRHSTLQ